MEMDKLVEEGPVSVFLFRHHIHFTKPLGLEELIGNGILKAAPQSAMELSTERYIKIRERVGSMDVLLSIKPKFAESIINGRKNTNFARMHSPRKI